jgi:hypothetical protein
MTDIELEETLAHIRQMRIDADHKLEDMRRIIAEHDQRRKETWWYPFALIAPILIAAFAAGGGTVVAGIALAKYLQ